MVVDASTVVAALVDTGPDGVWAEQLLESNEVVAPLLIQAECANVLSRLKSSQKINELNASIAYRNLLALPIALFPFEPFAVRVWALRENFTSYDAWYVALAEDLGLSLATLNKRLINAPGASCQFVFPEHSRGK